MDENQKIEDEALAEYTGARRTVGSHPAATTPSAPAGAFGQFNDLLQVMVGMETWKEKLLANERARENTVRARLEAEFMSRAADGVTEQMDPGVKMALEVLVEAFKGSMNAKPVIPQAQTIPPVNPSDFVPTPTAPPTEEPMITQAQADQIADKIFDKFPDDVRAAQSGSISKEAAIAKIVLGGATPAAAALIYQSIMDTDFDSQPAVKP